MQRITPLQLASDAVASAQAVAESETLSDEEAVERGGLGLIVAVLGLIGFGGIFALVRAKRAAAIDLGVTMKLQRLRNPWLARLMAAASWPGFPPQSRVIPPMVIGTMWLTRFRLEAGFQLLAWCTGLLSTVVKGVMRRPRPEGAGLRVVVAPLGGSSFPSGHTITYVGTYGYLAYVVHTLLRPKRLRRSIVAFLAGLIALVGPSRIYQGHHWPTDVSASYLLGISYLIGVTSLYRRIKAHLTRS